jgi:hypothetical protein
METDPLPQDTVLKLQLNDSLSRYDYLEITLLDHQDTNRILENVFLGPLPGDSHIPDHILQEARDRDFIVKVAGYTSDKQLLLETLIYYQGGQRSVVHKPVPPYLPRVQLQTISASIGTLTPAFNAEVTYYQLLVPEGASSLTLGIKPVFARAQVTLDGDSIPFGSASKPIAIDTVRDTVAIQVTDASQGPAFTRGYRIILVPTLPPPLQLASLVPSVGSLVPPFRPDITMYTLSLPYAVDRVTFTMRPLVPSSMTMIFSGFSIFPGEASRPIIVDPGRSDLAYVEVHRASEMTYYQVIVDRADKP